MCWIPVSSCSHYEAILSSELASRLRHSCIASIALGELYFGAYGSPTRASAALTDVASLSASYPILGADAVTAEIYRRIKQELKRVGRAIPDNDLWIAAVAIQYDVVLAARDTHFDWIAGLRVEQW